MSCVSDIDTVENIEDAHHTLEDIHGNPQTVALVIFENRLKHHQLEKHYGTNLPPLPYQSLALQQVWINLLSNVLDAIPDRGKVSIYPNLGKATNSETPSLSS
ncbi:MAG: hypothetical protein VX212_00990 [Pseudomonadota bacterium]|nr:hypothetical protein [Pseudomonadota bacterium]